MALRPHDLSHVADELGELWWALETRLTKDIAERLRHNDFSPTAMANWNYHKAQQLGYQSKYLNEEIGKILGKSKSEIRKIFEDSVIKKGIMANQDIFNEAYEKGIIASSGIDIAKYMNIMNRGALSVYHDLNNWTKSLYGASQREFQLMLDFAYLNVNSGLLGVDQAVKQSVELLAKNGIRTGSATRGRIERADVIVKRAVRTGVNITTGKVMVGVCDDLECDLVEVSSHLGARESHVFWQGKVYSRSGKNKKYPPFTETNYGSIDGLCGVNCRHTFYPFFEGLSTVSSEKVRQTENVAQYEHEQGLNKIELVERNLSRQKQVLDAGGQNSALVNQKLIACRQDKKAYLDNSPYLNSGKRKIISIKEEFMKSATPGVGKVTFGEGFRIKGHDHEIEIGNWLLNTFGGKIELLPEYRNQKNPDYLWNGEFWDLKSPKGNKNITKLIQKGISQIENSPGGIILNYKFEDYDVDLTKKIIEERMKNKKFKIVVILKRNDKIIDIIKR